MADNQQENEGPDLAAIVHAIEDDPKPEVAIDRIAQAVATAPAGSGRKSRPRNGAAKATQAVPPVAVADIEPLQPARTQPLNSTPEETIMTDETVNTINDNANQQAEALHSYAATAQDRMKTFYERSNGLVGEMSELGRGNVEAIVESGRILATGLQDIGRTTLEESRTAYEGLTDDVKRLAAVKSPTELLQLQSELARRNLDAVITQTSKNSEAMLKLMNDMFAPVSSRVSVTVEKLSKAA